MCRERWQPAAETLDRAIVRDVPGQALHLVMYADDGRSVAVPLSPIRALVIVGELIEAAARRLG